MKIYAIVKRSAGSPNKIINYYLKEKSANNRCEILQKNRQPLSEYTVEPIYVEEE